MLITIKTLDGQKKPFNLEENDTVAKVKEMLAEKTGIYKEMIRLIFQGSPMPDDKTLKQLNVNAGSVIHMIMQMRGDYWIIDYVCSLVVGVVVVVVVKKCLNSSSERVNERSKGTTNFNSLANFYILHF